MVISHDILLKVLDKFLLMNPQCAAVCKFVHRGEKTEGAVDRNIMYIVTGQAAITIVRIRCL